MGKKKNTKKLIFIDLDKTLIDSDYKTTLPKAELAKYFRKVSKKDLVVGISSDSAIGTIEDIANECNIIGPIIAENGSLLSTTANPGVHEENIKKVNFFPDLRKAIMEQLYGKTTAIVVGNVNLLSRSLRGSTYNLGPIDRIIMVNAYRRASMSFYAIGKVKGKWQKTRGIIEEAVKDVKGIIRKDFPGCLKRCVFDVNHDYGICIIREKGVSKSSAIPKIKKKYPGYEIYVIGDSMGDLYNISGIIHCAVGNASLEFKKRCLLIAKNSYSKGVVELVDKIISK